ncbi:hypothetical protein GF407_00360 [candidate division KSB1 bacterium]|nr:hypothetical protein [candidate division KSB1 bacterium]
MNKTIDCVEMKHKGAQKIRKKIGKLKQKKELQFWKEMTAFLKEWKLELEAKKKIET